MFLSVVIPTVNRAGSLTKALESLSQQTYRSTGFEIIVVDNESQDETLDLCRQFQARVVSIGREEFTYGRALNLGIGHAQGELCLLLSAHALPVGSYFLETCVAP